jgi:hypothetical protein
MCIVFTETLIHFDTSKKIQGRSQESKLMHQMQEADTAMPHRLSVRFISV